MREKVEAELDRLVAEGTIVLVEYSDWATPIAAVVKSDRKSIRIYSNFKVTVNSVSQLHRYPIPKIEDIFAMHTRGWKDLYQTGFKPGLPAIWMLSHRSGDQHPQGALQKPMETLLQRIPHVTVYIDDLLITGENDSDHLQTFETVLEHLAKAGLRAKKIKCKFMVP